MRFLRLLMVGLFWVLLIRLIGCVCLMCWMFGIWLRICALLIMRVGWRIGLFWRRCLLGCFACGLRLSGWCVCMWLVCWWV